MKITVIKKAATSRETAELLPMGCRGHLSSGEELRAAHGLRPVVFRIKRRTALWFWCGVVFFLSGVGCQTAALTLGGTGCTVLTIGFPRSGSPWTGIGPWATAQRLYPGGPDSGSVSMDGLPRLAESWSWENDGIRLRLRLRGDVISTTERSSHPASPQKH